MWTSTSTKDRRSQPEFKIGYPKRLLWDEFEQSEPEYFPIPKFRELVPRRSYSPTPTFSSHRIYPVTMKHCSTLPLCLPACYTLQEAPGQVSSTVWTVGIGVSGSAVAGRPN
ncbi:uncharacterized protein MCYG_01804 [Microsporum canis CBS 113480]|uniref:Uncharacterized protein n=1 Tax=Arthroderma otae (strain ATCC MYA-4605 / CBS 113480) TaxID=554155 RepID=C5FI05_ARTOC|nr:uncharacterized protein MCYG_01804 [Microsporum canis CBS 113480]EEQ28985.1 predicted protein [Microsporum canis CBS 113480]